MIGRSVRELPRGSLAVGASLLVNGASAYAFTVMAARTLGPSPYSTLSALLAVSFVVGPGFFYPMEQEITRALTARRAAGDGTRGDFVRIGLSGGILLAVVVLASATIARAPLLSLFDGDETLVLALCMLVAAYFSQHLVRGLFAGVERFDLYAWAISLEGLVRVVGGVVLVVADVSSVGWFGLVLAGSPVIGALLVAGLARGRLTDGPAVSWRAAFTGIGLLIGASVLIQLLAYVPVIAMNSIAADGESGVVARFFSGFLIVRIPLFLFLAIQATILPRLTRAVVTGNLDEFRRTLRSLTAVLAGIAVVGVAGAYAVGRPVMEIVFGEEFALDGADLAILAAASGTFMVAMLFAEALVALRGHRLSAIAWLLGLGAFAVAITRQAELLSRVEIAFLAGSVCAALSGGVLLAFRSRRSTSSLRAETIPSYPMDM